MKILINSFYKLNNGKGAKQFNRFKKQVIESNKGYAMILKALFPDTEGLFDLVLLTVMHNISFSITGPHCYLNTILVSGNRPDNVISFDELSGEFRAEKRHMIIIYESDIVEERLKRWVKAAINHISFFNFTNLNGENKLSECIKKMKFNNKSISTCKDNVTSKDFEVITIDKANQMIFYDIDGICGIAEPMNAVGFKYDITVECSRLLKYHIIEKTQVIMIDGTLRSIKECYSVAIGYITIDKDMKMPIFLVIGALDTMINKNERDKIAQAFKKAFLIATQGFKDSYRSKTLYMNEKGEFGGLMSGYELKELVEVFGKEYNDYSTFIYYECLGCKNTFSSTDVNSLTEKLWQYIDLRYLQPNIDVCCNIGARDKHDYTLFYPEGYLNDSTASSKYNLFLSKQIYNYNQKQDVLKQYRVKRRSVKFNAKKLFIRRNGIRKLNLYTPIVTNFLDAPIKRLSFPVQSSIRLFTNEKLVDVDKRHLKRKENLKKLIEDALEKIKSTMYTNIFARFEMRISIFNLPFIENLYEKLITEHRFMCYKTSNLYQILLKEFQLMIEKMQDNISFEEVARLSLYEVVFMEFFIKGGKNLHILPSRFRKMIEDHRCDGIGTLEFIKDIQIEEDEVIHMCFKLLECLKSQSYERQKSNIISLIKMNYLRRSSLIAKKIVDQYFEDMIKISGSKEIKSILMMGNKFVMGTPMHFNEFMDVYFKNAEKEVKYQLYRSYYELAVIKKMDMDVDKEIIKIFTEEGIRYMTSRNASGRRILNQLIYGNEVTVNNIEVKKELVKESLVNYEYAKNMSFGIDYHEERQIVLKSVSKSECFLYEYGRNRDKKEFTQVNQAIFNDGKYPFLYYSTKERMDYMKKCLERMKAGRNQIVNEEFFKEAASFNIKDMNLYAHLRFFIANGIAFKSAEGIRVYEELLNLSCERDIIIKRAEYYEALHLHQFDLKLSSQDYKFLTDRASFYDFSVETASKIVETEDNHKILDLNEDLDTKNSNVIKETELTSKDELVYDFIKGYFLQNPNAAKLFIPKQFRKMLRTIQVETEDELMSIIKRLSNQGLIILSNNQKNILFKERL